MILRTKAFFHSSEGSYCTNTPCCAFKIAAPAASETALSPVAVALHANACLELLNLQVHVLGSRS